MKKVFGFVLALGLGIAIAVGAIFWHGVGARNEPGPIETRIARSLRNLSIISMDRDRRNPILVNDQVLAEGRAHWADHCAICHANDGSGDTPLGRNLYPRAPDMRKRETQQLTDGELFVIIRDGVRSTGMPGWGGSSDDNWKLVLFVRHLPHLTPEEIEAMERLNPKTPEEFERLKHEQEFLKGH